MINKKRKLTGDKNQCPGCSKYFNSSYAFEKHRTGKHENNQRRCKTLEEMLAAGMVINKEDWWVSCLHTPDSLAMTTRTPQDVVSNA